MDDDEICKVISLSVGAIMRQSLNDSFKEECKNILGAADTKSLEEILCDKLKKLTKKETGFVERAATSTNTSGDSSVLTETQMQTPDKNDIKGNEVSSQVNFSPQTADHLLLGNAASSSQHWVSDDEPDLERK